MRVDIKLVSFDDSLQKALTLTLNPRRQLRPHRRSLRADVSRISLDTLYHRLTEPRDKIFVLYALLSSIGLQLADPDYTKSVPDIIRDTTIDVI